MEQSRQFWIRIIEKFAGHNNQFSEQWKPVVTKTPTEIVRNIAVSFHQFHKELIHLFKLKEVPTPLHVAAGIGHLELCKYIAEK